MKIQILGTGCAKCKMLTEHAERAVTELGLAAEVVKVTDMDEILSYGIMMTPGLAIDGSVKSSGKVISTEKIKEMLLTEVGR